MISSKRGDTLLFYCQLVIKVELKEVQMRLEY